MLHHRVSSRWATFAFPRPSPSNLSHPYCVRDITLGFESGISYFPGQHSHCKTIKHQRPLHKFTHRIALPRHEVLVGDGEVGVLHSNDSSSGTTTQYMTIAEHHDPEEDEVPGEAPCSQTGVRMNHQSMVLFMSKHYTRLLERVLRVYKATKLHDYDV